MGITQENGHICGRDVGVSERFGDLLDIVRVLDKDGGDDGRFGWRDISAELLHPSDLFHDILADGGEEVQFRKLHHAIDTAFAVPRGGLGPGEKVHPSRVLAEDIPAAFQVAQDITYTPIVLAQTGAGGVEESLQILEGFSGLLDIGPLQAGQDG